MPLTLVQLLAARGLAQVDLQAAEARRVKLGGGLETSLLELGVLGEPAIGELWSEASRLPRAQPELIAEVTSAMASLFPQQLAERYGMVPLGLVRRQLSLLARHPVDLSTVDEISFLLSRPLKLYVGTELEIAELLGIVYGVAVPQRLKDLRAKLSGPSGAPAPSVASAPSVAPVPAVAPASVPADGSPHSDPLPQGEEKKEATPAEAGSPHPDPLPSEGERAEAAASPPEPGPAPEEEREETVPAESEPTPFVPAPAQTPLPTSLPPPRRSLSPGEPWSIKFPLVEPPSASRRVKPAVESEPRAEASPEPAPEPGPQWQPSPQETQIEAARPALAALEPAPPEPVEEPPPQVAPAPQEAQEAPAAFVPPDPPSEPGPVEATPMSSGYGGRAGPVHRMSPAEAMAALKEEQTRDGVIGVVVDFLRGAFDFVAVFVRREDTFQVFEATGIDYGGGADLTQTIVDLERSRVLKAVVDGKAPYVGPIPPGDPLEGALGALGRGRLRAVLMYPVVVRDRTIAVVHGDRGGEALAPRQLSDVALVLSQMGLQLERVIQRRKKQRASPPRPRPAASPMAPSPIQAAPVSRPAPVEAPPAPPPLPQALPQASPRAIPPPASPEVEPAIASAPTEPVWAPPAVDSPPRAEVAEPPPAPPPPPPEAFSMAPPSSVEDYSAPPEDFEALAAAQYESIAEEEELFEVPVEWIDPSQGGEMADHVRAFLSGDPPARAAAAEALRSGGEDAAWALSDRFPGPLFVFRMTIDELPAPEAMGPVIGMLASLGPVALPALSSLSESPNEERRFWATMLIAKTGHHEYVPVLARRLLDSSPDVALAARRGLWRLRQAPEFAEVLRHAMSELNGGDPERSIPLIRALGLFHHVPAIPLLIGMLGSRDSQVLQTANEALREIARQDFGTSERRWSAWWEQAKSRPRLHWVIAALEDRDRDLRLAAISELTELTGFDFGYQSDLEPGRQAAALQRWREWLERDGRSRTPLPFPASGG